jgi:para-aminobenzoate synthetase / 4-amino-4-deoxychorismate lyase
MTFNGIVPSPLGSSFTANIIGLNSRLRDSGHSPYDACVEMKPMSAHVPEDALISRSARWHEVVASTPASALLKTARTDQENSRSYLFLDPIQILVAMTPGEIPGVFEQMEKYLSAGSWVCGFLSYEAGCHFEPAVLRGAAMPPGGELPLVWFGVYENAVVLDAACQRDEEQLAAALQTGGSVEPERELSAESYGEKIERIRRYIAAGDVYQANYTLKLRQRWPWGAKALFERAVANQPVPYAALLNTGRTQIVSASPELFFRKRGDEIQVRPMKGTAHRGRDTSEDARIAAWLANDEKNRAENVMIVDLLRNDLGRICRPGTICTSELFRVDRYPDLFQMVSTVRGQLRPGVGWYEIFRSLFPCGSITGAPKIRAMQIIRELEAEARGIGCGAIGFIAPGGDATFSVAIRTMALQGENLEMRVGSGITFGSDARLEYAECLLKAAFLTREPREFELIETLRWDGEYFLLDLHLDRLADSAAYFDFKADRDAVRKALIEYAERLERGAAHRVRMLVGRTGETTITSERIVLASGDGEIALYPDKVESADPFLRHKTTRRSVYDAALKEARVLGFDDALFLNEREEVTECSVHNLIIEKDGRRLTPALDCGVLPGVYRRYLMRDEGVEEAVLRFQDVLAADRVFICNSVQGMRRVRCEADAWVTLRSGGDVGV